MESSDREIIRKMIEVDMRLKRLYQEHETLEKELSRFESRPFLTLPDELEQKKLKVKKLRGVDKMMRLIADHRPAAA